MVFHLDLAREVFVIQQILLPFAPSLLCSVRDFSRSANIATNLPDLEQFKSAHPELADVVDRIPDVLTADRAPATVTKYA